MICGCHGRRDLTPHTSLRASGVSWLPCSRSPQAMAAERASGHASLMPLRLSRRAPRSGLVAGLRRTPALCPGPVDMTLARGDGPKTVEGAAPFGGPLACRGEKASLRLKARVSATRLDVPSSWALPPYPRSRAIGVASVRAACAQQARHHRTAPTQRRGSRQ